MVIIMGQIMEEMVIVGEEQGVATSMDQCLIVVDQMVQMVKMMWLMEMVVVMEQERIQACGPSASLKKQRMTLTIISMSYVID